MKLPDVKPLKNVDAVNKTVSRWLAVCGPTLLRKLSTDSRQSVLSLFTLKDPFQSAWFRYGRQMATLHGSKTMMERIDATVQRVFVTEAAYTAYTAYYLGAKWEDVKVTPSKLP